MGTHHPKYITYKGAKYERVGLVNEIVVAPGGVYTLFKNQDDTPDDNILQFKGYIRGTTALDAWKTWFNESGEKEIEKIYDDSPENVGDGRKAKDVDDFLDNLDPKMEHDRDMMLDLPNKTLQLDVLRSAVEIPTYLIFRGKLPQETIDAILDLGIYSILDSMYHPDGNL